MKKINDDGYMQALKKRSVQRNITHEFQFIGLEIATALRDLKHKALYIKYAKEYGSEKVLALAKDVASRTDIKNPAAYFMTMIREFKKIPTKR